MRKCAKCGIVDEMGDVNHHIIPLALGGTDKDGRIVLCGRCHDDFHKRHYGLMMRLIAENGLKGVAIERTLNYYEWWLVHG